MAWIYIIIIYFVVRFYLFFVYLHVVTTYLWRERIVSQITDSQSSFEPGLLLLNVSYCTKWFTNKAFIIIIWFIINQVYIYYSHGAAALASIRTTIREKLWAIFHESSYELTQVRPSHQRHIIVECRIVTRSENNMSLTILNVWTWYASGASRHDTIK